MECVHVRPKVTASVKEHCTKTKPDLFEYGFGCDKCLLSTKPERLNQVETY